MASPHRMRTRTLLIPIGKPALFVLNNDVLHPIAYVKDKIELQQLEFAIMEDLVDFIRRTGGSINHMRVDNEIPSYTHQIEA